MKPIYLDMTNIPELMHYTGISRVVTELAVRLMQQHLPMVLLSYSAAHHAYQVMQKEAFLLHTRGMLDETAKCYTAEFLTAEDFVQGSTFLDISSCWHTLPNRSFLLPQLKNRQVKIFVMLYDLIPVRHPEYLADGTLLQFLEYLHAHLQYADRILVNTQAVRADVLTLFRELELPEKSVQVLPLGADFSIEKNACVDENAELLRRLTGRRYLLTVGTIEPRKNHAVILEAYQKTLADREIDLIFVGHVGWQMETFLQQVQHDVHFQNGLYLLEQVSDAVLEELYRNAFLVVFASLAEGYGLPTIEALQHGVPVLCSDIPVMREVGGIYADYFAPEDAAALAAAVLWYAEEPQRYAARRQQIQQNYQPPKWSDAAQQLAKCLTEPETLETTPPPFPHKPVKQIVFLSARPAPLLASLPYVEAFLPFLTELVVCCPAKMAAYLHTHYQGRLKLKTVTDDALLAGRKLPPDHSTRNFFLRCLTMELDWLEEEFIMSDDDYRPLRPLTEAVFYRDGKYRGYYFADIRSWKYQISHLFSYDTSHFRTLHFLQANGYPTLQYSSHQPQLINRVWYQELLRKFPDISLKGYDEWSVYFNYCAAVHSNEFSAEPYVTLSWPPVGGENKGVVQPEYLFENFYAEDYQSGRLFAGLSRVFTDTAQVAEETAQKEQLAMKCRLLTEEAAVRQTVQDTAYEAQYGEFPEVSLYYGQDGAPELHVPCTLTLYRQHSNRVRLSVARAAECPANLLSAVIEMHLTDKDGNVLLYQTFQMPPQQVYSYLTFCLPENLPESLILRFSSYLPGRVERTEQMLPIAIQP